MTPAVSVVIATYNYGQFIGDAVASVLRQTFPRFDLVIVDDGSTDGTGEILQPFLTDARVRYYRVAHQGQAAAKNLGVDLAQGTFIAFLDADDVWLPGKLQRQMELFAADAGLGVVYARRLLIDAEGRPLVYEQPELYGGAILERLFVNNFICFSSAVVRREVFLQVGGFDTNLALAVDYDFWLRVASRHRFNYVDEPLVKYRTGHASLSRRAEERLLTVRGIMQRFLDCREEGGLLPPDVVRRAQAETCSHIALAGRDRSRWAAFAWYARALAQEPTYLPAWRGLVSLSLPELARRCLRRVLGKPVDWSVRRRLPVDEPPQTAVAKATR